MPGHDSHRDWFSPIPRPSLGRTRPFAADRASQQNAAGLGPKPDEPQNVAPSTIDVLKGTDLEVDVLLAEADAICAIDPAGVGQRLHNLMTRATGCPLPRDALEADYRVARDVLRGFVAEHGLRPPFSEMSQAEAVAHWRKLLPADASSNVHARFIARSKYLCGTQSLEGVWGFSKSGHDAARRIVQLLDSESSNPTPRPGDISAHAAPRTAPPPLPPQYAAGSPVTPSLTAAQAAELAQDYEEILDQLATAIDYASVAIHAANVRAGWWADPATGSPKKRNFFEMLALVHSEVSEALEGHRKGLRDDKLPERPMVVVEFADAFIRMLDIAGAMRMPLGTVLVEKAQFNLTRADHKPENRVKAGGKAI